MCTGGIRKMTCAEGEDSVSVTCLLLHLLLFQGRGKLNSSANDLVQLRQTELRCPPFTVAVCCTHVVVSRLPDGKMERDQVLQHSITEP